MTDYYDRLGIPKTASVEQIKAAYRNAAMKYHPDRNKDPEAVAKFKEISEAYETLSDEIKRTHYDNKCADSPLFSDDIFAPPRWHRGEFPTKGEPLTYNYHVHLHEIIVPFEKDLSVRRESHCNKCAAKGIKLGRTKVACSICRGTGRLSQQYKIRSAQVRETVLCSNCAGSGRSMREMDKCAGCNGCGNILEEITIKFSVPAGIAPDFVVAARGQGNIGRNGGPRGDVMVRFHVEDHPVWKRQGSNIIAKISITFVQACLGGTSKVEMLDGSLDEVQIPTFCKSGTEIVLNGKGLVDIRNDQKGDAKIRFFVTVPEQLSAEQLDLINKLAELEKS